MTYSLVTADIHLLPDDSHPINQAFYRFLDTEAPKADVLYLLGDIFEAWVGDDAGLEQYKTVIQKFKNLTDQGLPIYLMYGNRDFLMRKAFWQATGIQYLKEPAKIDFYGLPVLLMHGDALCTADKEYQRMRSIVRNPLVQWFFLVKSKTKRIEIGQQMRQKSIERGQNKPENIMDVDQTSVKQLFSAYPECNHLIHGHTHRPAKHLFMVNGKSKTRWVLGDWRPQAQIIRINHQQQIDLYTFE